jgi:hypothetical protein
MVSSASCLDANQATRSVSRSSSSLRERYCARPGARIPLSLFELRRTHDPLAETRSYEHLKRFITHSENKSGGTANRGEHLASRFVVGPGNANT